MKGIQVIRLAGDQLRAAHELVGMMRPSLQSPDRPRCALFLTMVEQFEATLILAQNGLASHGAIHVRSMLEALADYRLLETHPRHVDQMRFDQLHGERKLYRRILDLPEVPQAERTVIEGRLTETASRYQPLYDQKFRPSVIAEKFSSAGLVHMLGPYTMLCSFAHNDLAALAQRHQGDAGMTLRAGDSEEVQCLVLSTASFALLTAASALNGPALFPDDHFTANMDVLNKSYETMTSFAPKQ